MGGLDRRFAGRRYRRARRIHGGRRGVVSVVGTLLALLVFFALFGIFLTQYLPLWMNDNESQFTAQTQESAATLKSNVDFQVASQSPPVLATPFTMNSQGVPVLAQPTTGTLNFVPHLPGVYTNISVSQGPGGGLPFYQNFSLGTLTMSLPNRYYTPQVFEFENDAVIQSQSGTQQILLYPPTIQPTVSAGFTNLTMVMVQLYGNATQAVASGSEEVFTHFLYEQNFTSSATVSPLTVTFAIGTHYRCAWGTFLQSNLPHYGLALGTGFTLAPNLASYCASSPGIDPQNLVVTFPNITSFTLVVAGINIVVGVGVE
ncbi:MAG TPA: hypothetical protein VFF67_01320 [Thermoplasmata archaeon]|nr:hypothetical protein [Thermoplasmata archaeon]